MAALELIVTGDGSHSLYNPTLDETYHSRHGARQESEHVFIEHGMAYLLSARRDKNKPVDLLEVGLGTGLNALLTCQLSARVQQPVRYFAVEPFPLEHHLWSRLNYAGPHHEERERFEQIHTCPWEQPVALTPWFSLHKMRQSLQAADFGPRTFDLVYYDAFAPGKQPDMWEAETIALTTDRLHSGGVWVTYSARGQLKRDLRAMGLTVEVLTGPPGKKEMIRALRG